MQHNYDAEVEGFTQSNNAPSYPQNASLSNDQTIEAPWHQGYREQAEPAPRTDAMHPAADSSQQEQQQQQLPGYVPATDRLHSLESKAQLLRHQLVQARSSTSFSPINNRSGMGCGC